MSKTIAYLQNATNNKKFKVTILYPNGRKKTVQFGAKGYSDYTIHKDKERMKRYDSRHKPRENWTKSGMDTAGFWSKWILWSKPSLNTAVSYTSKKFNITIKRGPPPLKSRKSTKKKSRKSTKKKSRKSTKKKSHKSTKKKSRKSTKKKSRKSTKKKSRKSTKKKSRK